jgi:hypothetical protein
MSDAPWWWKFLVVAGGALLALAIVYPTLTSG